MTDSNVRELPANVTLDLDAYERPAKDVKEPFTVKLGGQVVTFKDPEDLDWQDLLDIENPVDFLRYCVTREERLHILSLEMPGHKFAKLMESYQVHFGLEEKMQQARRRSQRGL